GSERVDARPDLITTAKGLTSGCDWRSRHARSSRRAGCARRRHVQPWPDLQRPSSWSRSRAENIEIIEREGLLENVRSNEPWLQKQLNALRTLPIVGEVRGMGHFWAIELVSDQKTKATIGEQDRDWLLRDFLSARLEERG